MHFIWIFIICSLFQLEAIALDGSEEAPILIKANILDYDENGQVVTATGNVEIIQADKLMLADLAIYDQSKHLITAFGNISIKEVNGDMAFAKQMSMSDDFTHGKMTTFSSRTHDGTIIISDGAQIIAKDHYELDKATYTSCQSCQGQVPQWQLRAKHVEIDKQTKRAYYRNAFFEIYGRPVLFTPYFSHPLSDGKSQTGLLAPKLSTDTNLGPNITIPLYISLAPNKELIILPRFTQRAGTIISAEFNHLTKLGLYGLEGSTNKFSTTKTQDNNRMPNVKKSRYHLAGHGEFKLSDKWNSTFKFTKVSDKTYLRDYGLSGDNFLTSTAALEYSNKRNYSSIRALYFTRLIDLPLAQEAPYVFPYVNMHNEIDQDIYPGSRLYVDSNIMSLTREEGTESKRASVTGSWSKTYIMKHGSVIKLTASTRGDAYHVSDVIRLAPATGKFSGSVGRVLPEARFDWRLPFINKFSKMNVMIEPIADLVLRPNLANNWKIPNEDSILAELSDDNLFKSNHYAGFDLIESGNTASYALSASVAAPKNRKLSTMFGQLYRFQPNDSFNPGSGMTKKASDYVGRVIITPIEALDLAYRFRLDRSNFASRRNEVGANLKVWRANLNMTYVSVSDLEVDKQNSKASKKQLYTAASFAITPQWSIGANMRKNLAKHEKELIGTGLNISYSGDCATLVYTMTKDCTKNPTNHRKGSTTHFINITLKNLIN